MSIKEFKVFTLDRIAIYLGACWLFPVLVCAQAVRYNYFEKHQGIPLPGWIAMVGALAGFALGNVMLFKARYDFKKQITGYSDSGVGVLMPSWIKDAPEFDVITKDIDAAVVEVVTFWQKFYPDSADKMEAYINGSMLGFSSTVIDLLVHAPFGPMAIPSGFQRWAVGATASNGMLVQWEAGETWKGSVLARVKHELSHVCLNGIGLLDETQDQLMINDKFQY